jgi:hypothetical protein
MDFKYTSAIVEMGVRLRVTAPASALALIYYHRFVGL